MENSLRSVTYPSKSHDNKKVIDISFKHRALAVMSYKFHLGNLNTKPLAFCHLKVHMTNEVSILLRFSGCNWSMESYSILYGRHLVLLFILRLQVVNCSPLLFFP